jgi:hypothetical protein
MTDADMSMLSVAGGTGDDQNPLSQALSSAQLSRVTRPPAKGRRMTLMEELSMKKLNPGTSKKVEKEKDAKLGLNTLMAQIAERRKALTEEGNIIRKDKDKAIDEESNENSSSEDSFD